MIKDRDGRPRTGTGASLAAEAEGYLLAHDHYEAARREARELCTRMPWLTTGQAEEVARHYVDLRLDLTRQMLRSTIRRAAELRQEYEARYRELRGALLRRHAVGACAVLSCATGLGAAVGTLAR
ncbi:hypothetical protein [Streptomyces glaucus]|uniref:Uncharacterized protein n=1 Tax=Streptomyces glaucus TaxID=284029 RepID=A0ABN3JBB8_9ACTN